VAYGDAVATSDAPLAPTTSRRTFLAGAAAAAAAVAVGTGARGAPARAAAPVPPVPAAPAGGAPSWVAAGTRITHYGAVANVSSGSYELVEDPDGPLVDPDTGVHYREMFVAQLTGGGTGSGDGYWEVTVAAVDGTDVILARTSYLNDAINGVFFPGASSVERVAGAAAPLLWTHPDQLAAAHSDPAGTRLILHGPITLGATTYDAVSVVEPDPAAYSFFAFDTASGVLLTSALRNGTVLGGGVQMSTTELRNVRQLSLPGIGTPVPAWVQPNVQLSYRGTQTFVNPLDPRSPPMVSSMSATVRFTEVGATWAMRETVVDDELGGSATSTGVSTGIGPYWWDPQSLAAMQPGQTLDQDPVTGQTLTVGQPNGAPAAGAVLISSAMNGISTDSWYDAASGVLLAQTYATASSGFTTQVQLVGQG